MRFFRSWACCAACGNVMSHDFSMSSTERFIGCPLQLWPSTTRTVHSNSPLSGGMRHTCPNSSSLQRLTLSTMQQFSLSISVRQCTRLTQLDIVHRYTSVNSLQSLSPQSSICIIQVQRADDMTNQTSIQSSRMRPLLIYSLGLIYTPPAV